MFLATKNAAVVNHIGESEVFEVVKVGVPENPNTLLQQPWNWVTHVFFGESKQRRPERGEWTVG